MAEPPVEPRLSAAAGVATAAAGVAPARPVPVILRCDEVVPGAIDTLVRRYAVLAVRLDPDADIPGSFWGPPEAGLAGRQLFYRDDTPVHSLLHELAHYVCMDAARRQGLDTDAGGDDAEECAVCYLEILLADTLEPFSQARCLADMDAWGYSFREGSARAWFRGDGREALLWLAAAGLVDGDGRVSYRLRGEPA